MSKVKVKKEVDNLSVFTIYIKIIKSWRGGIYHSLLILSFKKKSKKIEQIYFSPNYLYLILKSNIGERERVNLAPRG